jgi:GTPase SAR1 family protein
MRRKFDVDIISVCQQVEVWDVVDRGKSRPRNATSLKLSASATAEQPALDAEFLDVYKGTHGVILMLDITKNWTFEYVQKELPKISTEIPVLILANHCDMNHHRTVSNGQVQALIEEYENRAAQVIYGESSMRNGFGLRLVHKFLGLPFLRLQRLSLLESLERNERDSHICSFEISEFLKSDDSNYTQFLDNLMNKRRVAADSNPKMLTPSRPLSFTPSSNTSQSPSALASIVSPVAPTVNYPNYLKPTKSIILGGGQPIPGASNGATTPALKQTTLPQTAAVSKSNSLDLKIDNVDEFCPEGGSGLDRTFLEDAVNVFDSPAGQRGGVDSDSDAETGNPLVAKFEDDTIDNLPVAEPVQDIARNLEKTKLAFNPLAKKKSDSTSRKLSLSSIEIDVVTKSDIENVETASGSDSWIDTKLRRSPEGGEDVSAQIVVHETTITPTDEDVGDEEGVTKKHKKKKSSKDKKDKSEKSSGKEKKKKRKSRDLDAAAASEFFGETSSIQQIDESYEAI